MRSFEWSSSTRSTGLGNSQALIQELATVDSAKPPVDRTLHEVFRATFECRFKTPKSPGLLQRGPGDRIYLCPAPALGDSCCFPGPSPLPVFRSEEHTSELQSPR